MAGEPEFVGRTSQRSPRLHAGEITSQPYFSTPIIYTGQCWCGYSTGKQAIERDAQMALDAHCHAKNAQLVEFVAIDGETLLVHAQNRCAGRPCCIHAPSDHHMVGWRRNWRGDRGLMERICPHGIGHPDPDDLAHKARTGGGRHEGIHGCDGCCFEPRP